MNIIGNVISGQVTGDTAKQLSERFGKIIQDRESVSINRSDNSVSKSVQLEVSVPPSRIAALSSGEFVGMVADNPDNKIELKVAGRCFDQTQRNRHGRLSCKKLIGKIKKGCPSILRQHLFAFNNVLYYLWSGMNEI